MPVPERTELKVTPERAGVGSFHNVARNVEATQDRSRSFNYATTLQLKRWRRWAATSPSSV